MSPQKVLNNQPPFAKKSQLYEAGFFNSGEIGSAGVDVLLGLQETKKIWKNTYRKDK
jgi:hypothetical protein